MRCLVGCFRFIFIFFVNICCVTTSWTHTFRCLWSFNCRVQVAVKDPGFTGIKFA